MECWCNNCDNEITLPDDIDVLAVMCPHCGKPTAVCNNCRWHFQNELDCDNCQFAFLKQLNKED